MSINKPCMPRMRKFTTVIIIMPMSTLWLKLETPLAYELETKNKIRTKSKAITGKMAFLLLVHCHITEGRMIRIEYCVQLCSWHCCCRYIKHWTSGGLHYTELNHAVLCILLLKQLIRIRLSLGIFLWWMCWSSRFQCSCTKMFPIEFLFCPHHALVGKFLTRSTAT